jgi:predicted RNase H-like HicB family nuclease
VANYIALIRKKKNTAFGVDFPDFPGCITVGDTLDEALSNSREALGLHIQGMNEDGERIPEPSSLEAVLKDPKNRDAVPCLVQLPRGKGRAIRINITVEENLLEEIDDAAASVGISRSAFIAEAARDKLRGDTIRVAQRRPKYGKPKKRKKR